MSVGYALLLSLSACGFAAVIEGLCAGRNVKSFFAQLHFPRYSAPLWVWSIIGGLYYVVFWFVLYRLFRLNNHSALHLATIVLIILMMLVNASTNYIIFRAHKLRLSFLVGALFPVLDITLLLFLAQLDTVAAWSLVPYLLYRIYAVWWGYAVWKNNQRLS